MLRPGTALQSYACVMRLSRPWADKCLNAVPIVCSYFISYFIKASGELCSEKSRAVSGVQLHRLAFVHRDASERIAVSVQDCRGTTYRHQPSLCTLREACAAIAWCDTHGRASLTAALGNRLPSAAASRWPLPEASHTRSSTWHRL